MIEEKNNKQNKNLYNEESIESLDALTFTRLRPFVYCGDTSYSTQLLVEIISNSIDEYRLGHGNKIEVTITKHHIAVRDYGQGFLVNSVRDDGKTVLEAAFSVLNTSGKYHDDGVYEGTSLGSFGIGSKLATFLSHYLIVTTYRGGQFESIYFNEGVFDQRVVKKSNGQPTGTYVEWQPSEEFFTSPEVEVTKVRELFKTLVCLCPGLKIEFTYLDAPTVTYYSENGLSDLADIAVQDNELIQHRFELQSSDGKNSIDMILTYTSNYSSTIVPYVNTGLTESGPHITAIKTAITREFNKFFKEKKWLKAGEANLSGDDIQEGMYIVFNITAPNVAYDAQVKSRITKLDMKPFNAAISQGLQEWLEYNEDEIKAIANKSINARKAREAAKKAREKVREGEKKKEKVLKFDSKLADCYSKDRSKCEIIITEGDSASGNLKAARNNEFQAVMPVRGKILNTQKASIDKIQKNAEIMTMIDAFGLTIDKTNMKVTYHPEDLRYDKIIIMSDADVDGSHIKNLFYTFIWNFCPELILDGHIYAGVPPLYKIQTTKGFTYLKNDEELAEYQEKNKGKKYEVTRLKGLGEMSPQETEETLIDPDNRILKQITLGDIQKTEQLFEDLMGTAITPRKDFIVKHSKEATYDI